jgi:branched-chain amino acid transport system permease protein
MLGAYFGAAMFARTESFLLGLIAAVVGAGLVGLLLDRFALTKLYERDHLDQVLATFGLILFFNELIRIIWGPSSVFMQVPDALSSTVEIAGFSYPSYRLAIIAAGVAVALGLWLLIQKTRVGMLIRAGATNAGMVAALGVNIKWLNTLVFALGAALAGLAGVMAGPIVSVQPGMGEPVLILTLVVIIIGGLGSIRGAFYAALIVGVVDTLGRAFMPTIMRTLFERSTADAAGPALASMLIYLFMAVVLALKPRGLFPANAGATR